MKKNIIIGVLLLVVVASVSTTVYAYNKTNVIYEIPSKDMQVSKMKDNNVTCYIATGRSDVDAFDMNQRNVSISCLK